MGTRLLLIAAWLVPVAILILGVNVGATIWIYQEPQMGAIPTPDSFRVALWSGVAALLLSVVVAVGISIHVVTSRTAAEPIE